MIIPQFKAARRCAVPLVAITTPDAGATVTAICEAIPNQVGEGDAARGVPKVVRAAGELRAVMARVATPRPMAAGGGS